ncbi:MAG TPA: hypothetical protein VFJ97_06985 [Dermatophilaceae bacterium]|nr:hypothetical protein [Dermatophilaceae bacterium]
MTTKSATPPSGGAPFAAMLRGALLPTLVLDGVVVLAALLLGGGRAGLAAALAVIVVTAFFAAGLSVMARLAGGSPVAFLAAALAVYLGQILFLGVVIIALARADWLDGTAFALAALAVALGWQAFQLLAFARMRKPVYDLSAADTADAGAERA